MSDSIASLSPNDTRPVMLAVMLPLILSLRAVWLANNKRIPVERAILAKYSNLSAVPNLLISDGFKSLSLSMIAENSSTITKSSGIF